MGKKSIVSAIDVGTSKVAAIMADAVDENSFQILGVGVSASKGLHKGVVVNYEEAREAVGEAVRKAEHAAGIKMETAYVGITGRHINSINTKSAVAVTHSDRVVSPGDLKRVLESARTVNTNAERRLLHVIPRTYTLDGQEGVKNGYDIDLSLVQDIFVTSFDKETRMKLLQLAIKYGNSMGRFLVLQFCSKHP